MRINKSKFRLFPKINATKGYMNIRGWRVSWLGFEVWHTEERPTLRNLGLWFFCKIGSPIFSPSQVAIGGATVCLWCGKKHGKLARQMRSK